MKYSKKIGLALCLFAISTVGQVPGVEFTEMLGNKSKILWLSSIHEDTEGNDRFFLVTVGVSNDAIPDLKLSEFKRKADAESIWTWEQVNQVEQKIDKESIKIDYDKQCKILSLSMEAIGNRLIKFFRHGGMDRRNMETFNQREGFVPEEKIEGSWISGQASLPSDDRSRIAELLFMNGNAFQLNLLRNSENPDKGLIQMLRVEGTSAMSDGLLKVEKAFFRNLDGTPREWRDQNPLLDEPIRMRYDAKCDELTLFLPASREGLYIVLRFNR